MYSHSSSTTFTRKELPLNTTVIKPEDLLVDAPPEFLKSSSPIPSNFFTVGNKIGFSSANSNIIFIDVDTKRVSQSPPNTGDSWLNVSTNQLAQRFFSIERSLNRGKLNYIEIWKDNECLHALSVPKQIEDLYVGLNPKPTKKIRILPNQENFLIVLINNDGYLVDIVKTEWKSIFLGKTKNLIPLANGQLVRFYDDPPAKMQCEIYGLDLNSMQVILISTHKIASSFLEYFFPGNHITNMQARSLSELKVPMISFLKIDQLTQELVIQQQFKLPQPADKTLLFPDGSSAFYTHNSKKRELFLVRKESLVATFEGILDTSAIGVLSDGRLVTQVENEKKQFYFYIHQIDSVVSYQKNLYQELLNLLVTAIEETPRDVLNIVLYYLCTPNTYHLENFHFQHKLDPSDMRALMQLEAFYQRNVSPNNSASLWVLQCFESLLQDGFESNLLECIVTLRSIPKTKQALSADAKLKGFINALHEKMIIEILKIQKRNFNDEDQAKLNMFLTINAPERIKVLYGMLLHCSIQNKGYSPRYFQFSLGADALKLQKQHFEIYFKLQDFDLNILAAECKMEYEKALEKYLVKPSPSFSSLKSE